MRLYPRTLIYAELVFTDDSYTRPDEGPWRTLYNGAALIGFWSDANETLVPITSVKRANRDSLQHAAMEAFKADLQLRFKETMNGPPIIQTDERNS
jgi:hypothetical protein